MTIDQLRALCLSLPGSTEKETWGDPDHAGDVTFRVHDKIYVITGQTGGSASIRTSAEEQAELMDTFPTLFRRAPYTGRFGWVVADLEKADDALLTTVIEGAWRRTAPKALVQAREEGRA